MKIGILITARLGSTRLAKKHLLKAKGKPLLYYLIKRITKAFSSELAREEVKVIISTSEEAENKEFERFVPEGVLVYYGSVNNIPWRHLQTAQAYALDAIISVDGDDILCSINGMRVVYDALKQGKSYISTTNLPFGMNSHGYSRYILETSLKGQSGAVLETGWGCIFDKAQKEVITVPCISCDNALRFTLDYDDDYQFFKTIIEHFGDAILVATDDSIINFVREQKLYQINEKISQEYWANFYKLQQEEQSKNNI